MSMTQILLTGHSGSFNKGCEALVRSTVDILKRHLRPTRIELLSDDPDSDRRALLPDLQEVPIHAALPPDSARYSFGWFAERIDNRLIRRVRPGLPSYSAWLARAYYQQADVVISIGGDTFSDDYEGPSAYFGDLALARRYGAFTVIWAASIGPFRSREAHWAKLLRQVDLITVREDKTLAYLQQLGVVDNVRRVADPAFLLPTQTTGAPQLAGAGQRRIIGLGMSALVAGYGSDPDSYLRAFTEFAQFLLADPDTDLLLIPHVVTAGNDDRIPCLALAERLGSNPRVQVIDAALNTCQMKQVIAQCSYFIGARTHSTIAALSSQVPTLSIGYSAKAVGINQDVFGHTDYVLAIQDLSTATLREKFSLLSAQRAIIVKRLSSQLSVVKAMSEQNGIYLREALRVKGVLA